MADKRITELDPMVEVVDAADVIPFVDVSADSGTGKTVKLRRDQLTPAGGTTEQHLVKASDDDFDYKYVDPLILGAAQLNYELPHGSAPQSFIANTYTKIPLNTEVANRIAGLSLGSAGVFTLPAGTFLIRVQCKPYNILRGALYLRNETGGWYLTHGLAHFSSSTTTSAYYNHPFVLEHMLAVATPTDFSVGAFVSKSERMGLPIASYISGEPAIPEVYATTTIQKVA